MVYIFINPACVFGLSSIFKNVSVSEMAYFRCIIKKFFCIIYFYVYVNLFSVFWTCYAAYTPHDMFMSHNLYTGG